MELNDTKLSALQQKLEAKRKGESAPPPPPPACVGAVCRQFSSIAEREKLKQDLTPVRHEALRRGSEVMACIAGG